MKIVKWSLVFAVGFAMSWILIFTFTQEPFAAFAPMKIFWYETPEFPIYVYVAGTFGIGLLFGFFAAAYYYVVGQAGIHGKKKEIRRLQDIVQERDDEIARLTKETETKLARMVKDHDAEIEKLRADITQAIGAASTPPKTKSQKAVAEKDFM